MSGRQSHATHPTEPDAAFSAREIEKLRAQENDLARVVKEQDLSPEEVIRMNDHHEQLLRTLADLRQKQAENQKSIMSLEISAANRAAAAEEAIDSYNHLLSVLNLFPPLPPPFDDIDLGLELNTAASNPQELLKGMDVRQHIRPTLNRIAESRRSERAGAETERLEFDRVLDQIVIECEDLELDINNVEKAALAKEDEANELREVRGAGVCDRSLRTDRAYSVDYTAGGSSQCRRSIAIDGRDYEGTQHRAAKRPRR